jgi:hypothetical protein
MKITATPVAVLDLAHAAIETDLRAAWFTLETLTAAVDKAKVDGTVARTVSGIYDCAANVVDDSREVARRPRRRGVLPRRYRLRTPLDSGNQQHHPSGFVSS